MTSSINSKLLDVSLMASSSASLEASLSSISCVNPNPQFSTGRDKEEVTREITFIRNSRNGLINGIYRDEAKIRSGKGHTISTSFVELISGQLFTASDYNSIVSLCNGKWTFKGFNHGI
jgi:hypothetical protein